MGEEKRSSKVAQMAMMGRPGMFRQVAGGVPERVEEAPRGVGDENRVLRKRVAELELEVAHLKRELAGRPPGGEARGPDRTNADRQRKHRLKRAGVRKGEGGDGE